jgi:hypothetical protein
MHEMELGCCWQVPCRGDGLVVAPSEEDLEEILLLVQFADYDGAFADVDQMVHLLSLFPRQEMWYDYERV